MTLPSHVDVGPYRYTVRLDQAAIDAASKTAKSHLVGHVDHVRQQISLDPNLAPDALAETVLHECIHAILEQTGLGLADATAERIVVTFGYAVLDLVRRNPELVAFLAEGTGGGEGG